jgi:hypothetical protein
VQQDELEPAVPAGTDPLEYAAMLTRVYDATLSGDRPPALGRLLVRESWKRTMRHGVNPDRRPGEGHTIGAEALEHHRQVSRLTELMPMVRHHLCPVSDEAEHVLVVHGADYVLWADGDRAVRHRLKSLGFAEGARWTENLVGTNATGTAMATQRPVQIHSAEHFERWQHAWTCAAAPVHDPRDGTLLGIINISGPAATGHPNNLALVNAVSELAEMHLRMAHHTELERLRAVAAPLLAKTQGRALVVDPDGWVAAVSGVTPVDRVLVPHGVENDRIWLPSLGQTLVEPVPGGWLLRPAAQDDADVTRVVLDLRRPSDCSLTVTGGAGTWEHRLTPRHAEILFLLAIHPAGRSASDLAVDLFGDSERATTVRAEMFRLRRYLGGMLRHRPYRFCEWIDVVIQRPENGVDLLPGSTAPAVVRLRCQPAAQAGN